MEIKEDDFQAVRGDVREIKTLLLDPNLGIIPLVKRHDCTLYGDGLKKEGLVNKFRNIWVLKVGTLIPIFIVIWMIFGDKIKAAVLG